MTPHMIMGPVDDDSSWVNFDGEVPREGETVIVEAAKTEANPYGIFRVIKVRWFFFGGDTDRRSEARVLVEPGDVCHQCGDIIDDLKESYANRPCFTCHHQNEQVAEVAPRLVDGTGS